MSFLFIYIASDKTDFYEIGKSTASDNPTTLNNETFETVATEWLEKRMIPICAKKYLQEIQSRLKRIVYPAIGHMQLADITSAIVLSMCRVIEQRGNFDMAKRIKILTGQVFRYAIATSRVDSDPTYALKGALQTYKERHYPTITDPTKISLLMRSIDTYHRDVMRHALKFSILTFCRPGEIRTAEWQEIDWDKAQWNIPPEKMKMKRPHIVPLSRQAIETLTELKLLTGDQQWIFTAVRHSDCHICGGAVRLALRTMGYSKDVITAHSFRSMASTILNENGWPPDVVERQLAHISGNAVRAAYNHAEYLPKRREMMQWWADWLDGLKK
ncbi:integrase [Synergistales bacterium]|nr:integrase [Synergistales bacterium]